MNATPPPSPFEAPAAPNASAEPPPPPVLRDVACVGCGYNLRGLSTAGQCPECALPVANSLRGRLLRHANPRYVRRLATGAALLACSWLIIVAIGIAPRILLPLLLRAGRPATMSATFSTMSMVLTILAALARLLAVAGAWLLTSPEPGQAGGLRSFIRVTALVGLPAWDVTVLTRFPMNVPLQMALWSLILLVEGVWLAGAIAQFPYLRQLALRVPAPTLARQTRIAVWPFAILAAMGLVTRAGFVLLFQVLRTPYSAVAPVTTFTNAVHLLSLPILLWWLVLLVVYWQRFRAQAALARQDWDSGPR